MCKIFVELQDQFRLKFYELGVINMNNSVLSFFKTVWNVLLDRQ
jgi:hypothetical protein